MFVMGPKDSSKLDLPATSFGSGMFVMGPKGCCFRGFSKSCFGSGMFVMGPKERGNYSKPD